MKPLQHLEFFVIATSLLLLSEFTAQSSLYTKQEVDAIKKLRPKVAHLLTLDYHKKDGYLLRYIRGNNFDLTKAFQALEKAHKWRKENDIDSLDLDNLKAHSKYLPCKVDGFDRDGRPIYILSWGKWKVRNYVIAGKQEDLKRQFRACLEKAIRSTFERAEATGQDIDQYTIIVDMDGFNARDGLCLGCVPLTLTLAANFESFSAFLAQHAIFINTPRIFQPVLALIRNAVRLPLYDYDSDKKNWQQALQKNIAPDQLPKSLGGTRPG